jgi:hypothetical protein
VARLAAHERKGFNTLAEVWNSIRTGPASKMAMPMGKQIFVGEGDVKG